MFEVDLSRSCSLISLPPSLFLSLSLPLSLSPPVSLSDVKDVTDPLSKVEAGLQAAGADVPLHCVHIRAQLVDLAAKVCVCVSVCLSVCLCLCVCVRAYVPCVICSLSFSLFSILIPSPTLPLSLPLPPSLSLPPPPSLPSSPSFPPSRW